MTTGEVERVLIENRARRFADELALHLRSTEFSRADLLVSFVMRSGVEVLAPALTDALERGMSIRLLTGTYLGVTQPEALSLLLDWQGDHPDHFAVRLRTEPDGRSFHPKAYLFHGEGGRSRGFVGSSNLSRSALIHGVEWNVAVDPAAELVAEFDRLWNDPPSTPLDAPSLQAYRAVRPPTRIRSLPTAVADEAEVAGALTEAEELDPPPQPTPVQAEVLSLLEATRREGYQRGLVVLATGLGKTYLAAFDSNRPEFRRVLFIAHRMELLKQARRTFRRLRPDASVGMVGEGRVELNADLVFASVQTLRNHLHRIAPDGFDYVVIDEFHHAAAPSYREVIAHVRPRFLLGLTATPERTDQADLVTLCEDNIVADVDLVEGIRRNLLSPFHYRGLPDTADYTPFARRRGEFTEAELESLVMNERRTEYSFEQWKALGGERTLAFCVSTAHADAMARYFASRGVAAVAVHSNPESAPREESIERLEGGDVSVLFSVDLFNEGLDVPAIDTVLMLRPTASPVLFLQQLGRGLRRSKDKDRLTVLDFVGNHRSFLLKPRLLMSLTAGRRLDEADAVALLRSGDFEPPPGCIFDFDLETIELLQRLSERTRPSGRLSGRTPLIGFLTSFTAEHGRRPTLVEAELAGLNGATAKKHLGGRNWFEALDRHPEGSLLTDAERGVVAHSDFLTAIETGSYTRSYKLVVLRALLQERALFSGLPLERLLAVSRGLVLADPRFRQDATSNSFDPENATDKAWEQHWLTNPINAWTGGNRQAGGEFDVVDGVFQPRFAVPAHVQPTLNEMVKEALEWQQLRYFERVRTSPGTGQGRTAVLRVSQNGNNPILFINRDAHPWLPEGEAEVIVDGRPWILRFVKVAVNVGWPVGESGNQLPDLLQSWFGEDAGARSTKHRVELVGNTDTLELRAVISAS